MDKYKINFSNEAKDKDKQRLINQLWKLIPMRENNEEWQSHLNILIEELVGLSKIYKDKEEGLILLSKLEGLDSEICKDFMIYRKTVFRCIDLITEVFQNE